MNEPQAPIAILGIGTAVPEHIIEQKETADRIAEALHDQPVLARFAKRIFQKCGVETRYTCEHNMLAPVNSCRYMPGSIAAARAPATAERMQVYREQALPLALQAAQLALADGQAAPSEVTHLVTVSCTGQFLPGLDALLVRSLGLSETVQRFPLTFLGCAAGLKALGLSRQLSFAHPTAKILIVCVELCTLHVQPSATKEDIFAASFFGDGASACLVGSADHTSRDLFLLTGAHSVLLPDSLSEMVWTVGNYGFELVLSPEIPKLIGQWVPQHLLPQLSGLARPTLWAIHPGGRAIIDRLQQVLQLTDEETRASRHILRHYGNMSSATILFVLEEMKKNLRLTKEQTADGVALAFGPGLTMESVTFTYRHAAALFAQEGRSVYV